MNKSAFRAAFVDTLPVMTGYLFLGFGFGIFLHENGYGPLWALAMSLLIYAGSMQFVCVSLMTGGASLLTAALSTLMVNARHLFYGLSMIQAYKDTGRKKPYLIFSLTDETYSLVSQKQEGPPVVRHGYYFWVSILDHFYWLSGSVLGGLAGQWIRMDFEGIDFVLTALFVTIFVEQWLSSKDHAPACIGVLSTLGCLLIFGPDAFLVPSMILITLILSLRKQDERSKCHD